MNDEFEIYFSDLNAEAQKRLLEYAEISDPTEANWDVFPIATILIETQRRNPRRNGI